MKPRELPWKWLLLGLGTLTLGMVLLPRLFGDTAQLGDRAAEQLSAWTDGEVTLVGPVTVRYFPDVSVTAGLELKGSKRLPMVESITVKEAKISIDLAELLLGHVRIDALALRRPKITLAEAAEPGAAPQSLLTGLVGGVPVSAVHVRGGKIIVPNGTAPERVEKINAHFDINEPQGGVSGFGKFTWRDVGVRFDLESGSVVDTPEGAKLPVSLVLTADPIRAKLEGTASLKNGFGLDGTMAVDIPDARRLLAWFGIPLGEGQGLKTLTASGAFHLAGATLTFDDGSFSLDGNKAQGLLALTGGARPRVEGTLDFDHLVLDPYLATAQTNGTEASPRPFRDSDPFDWPLVQALDADLRVSAAAIHAHGLKLGRGAITVTAKQGVIVAELGELELCGGSAAGRAGLDLTQAAKHLTLDASLTDIATESCLQQLAIDLPLKGVGGIKTEIAAEGRDAGELLKGLSGSLKITAHDGAVPVDFSRLMVATMPLEGQGWSPSASTPFAQLDADCRLGGGHLWCQTFSMQTPAGLVAGSGDIDLPAQTIDWDVAVASPAEAAKTSETTSQEIPKVSIRGSLAQPSIRRADRSTLGDGSPQALPLAPAVSQH